MAESFNFTDRPTPAQTGSKGFADAFNQQMQQAMQQSAQMKMMDLQHQMQTKYQQQERERALPQLSKLFGPDDAQAILNAPANMQGPMIKNLMERQGNIDYLNSLNGTQTGGQGAQPGQPQGMGTSSGQPRFQATPNMSSAQIKDLGHLAIDQANFDTREINRERARKDAQNFSERWNTSNREDKLDKQAKQEAQLDDKKTEEFYNGLRNKSETSEKQLLQFQKMEDLNNSGKLSSPKLVNFMDKFTRTTLGQYINFNTMLHPEDEEYNKTLQEFLTGMSRVFGGKVSNAEMTNWMKKFPSLMNSQEGRAEILKDLETWAEMDIDKYKTARDLYEQNGYIRPKGFDVMVEKAWKPKQNAYAQKYRQMLSGIPGNVAQALTANPQKGYRDAATGKRYAMLNGQPVEITETNIAEIKKQLGGQ